MLDVIHQLLTRYQVISTIVVQIQNCEEKMEWLSLVSLLVFICFVESQNIINDAKVDNKELRCLVCETSIHELSKAISEIDPNKKVDVGGYRLDIDGNYGHKSVPQAKSELVLSDMIENLCEKMDNYVRALRIQDGALTLLSMIDDSGNMNRAWNDYNIVQDDDLNKSLKYYCEEFMGEYEEEIIKFYQQEHKDIKRQFCVEHSKLCPSERHNEEL